MSGDATKIKIEASWVSYKGVNLGYTQGGITLSIESIQRELTIEEQGPIPQAIFSMGKRITVNVPLVETDYNRISSLLNSSSYKIDHLYGDDLMDHMGDLVISSIRDVADFITVHNALVLNPVGTRVNYDKESVWNITFIGYGTTTSLIDFAS